MTAAPIQKPEDLARLLITQSGSPPKDVVSFLINATVEAMKIARPAGEDERAWLVASMREIRDSLDKAIAAVEARP